jgi:hypothetical protein
MLSMVLGKRGFIPGMSMATAAETHPPVNGEGTDQKMVAGR